MLGFDVLKFPAVPLSQIDFVEAAVDNGCAVRAGKSRCFPAPGQSRGVNLFETNGGEGRLPASGLLPACLIQGDVGLTDEPAGTMTLDLSVTQNED